jgi:hypothetical protein
LLACVAVAATASLGGETDDAGAATPRGRKEIITMMGTKERNFAPLVNVSLEELVPQDHFYRHLERTLDLSFVREFVQETYAGGGRPSIDPIVFFKLQTLVYLCFAGRVARQDRGTVLSCQLLAVLLRFVLRPL